MTSSSRTSSAPLVLTCLSNQPTDLPDLQRGKHPELEGTYPITPGANYVAYGMMVVHNVFGFLVQDDWGAPDFAPAGLFELITGPIPNEWRFSLRPGIRLSSDFIGQDPVVAVWGYPEMIDDPDHVNNLFEREDDAMMIFIARTLEAKAALDPENEE